MPDGFKHRRLLYKGIVFDPWYDKLTESFSPEALLCNFIMAHHVSVPNILSDPTGNLTTIQKAVSKEYAKILPEFMEVAEYIIENNPQIVR